MISLAPSSRRGADALLRGGDVARLDLTENPYGPCPAALESLEATRWFPASELKNRLKQGLQRTYSVTTDSLILFDRIESAIQVILEEFPGPVVTFPPSLISTWCEHHCRNRAQVQMVRNPGRRGALDAEFAADLPWDGIALIESPSNPLGALVRPVDAVRLARACRLVVIDERFSEFAGHSLLGFAREFDNVVILRSFDAWAGLLDYPCGWAVAAPGVAEALAPRLHGPEPAAIAAAQATLESADSMGVTLRLLREERSRLFRTLRKYAVFEPLPSWGPFLSARVGFGLRDEIVDGLRAQDVATHAPAEAGLEDYIRFGLGTRSVMERFYAALQQMVPAIMNDALLSGSTDANRLALGGKELVEAKAGQIE